MKYKYTYRNTAGELWQLSMYYTYGSVVGMCNLIFTAAVIALTINKWNTVSGVWRFLLLLACCLEKGRKTGSGDRPGYGDGVWRRGNPHPGG